MTSKNAMTEAIQEALQMLKQKLPTELRYHNYEHTLDVLKAAERIGQSENMTGDDMLLLKAAAVFHDTGYILSRENHEEKSCSIARQVLSEKNISEEIIDKVCDIILATRIPQSPKDKLGEILCDADLDYLGRDDYFPISRNVYEEFKSFGQVKDENEWKEMQVRFLEAHHYFTQTAKRTRNEKKREHLMKIKNGQK